MKRVAATTRELAQGWLDCHGQPETITMLEGLLEYVESRTAHRVADWLETLAKPHTQPADYYAEAARKLRNDEWAVPVRSTEGDGR